MIIRVAVFLAWHLLNPIILDLSKAESLDNELREEILGICSESSKGNDDQELDLLRKFRLDLLKLPGVSEIIGSDSSQTAFKIGKNAHLTLPTREFFPLGLPDEFSIVITLRNRFPVKMPWQLIRIDDLSSTPQFLVIFNPKRSSVEIKFMDSFGKLRHFAFLRVNIFDQNWHKVHLAVRRDRVLLYIDCQLEDIIKVQRRGPLEVDVNGNITISKSTISTKTVPVDLQLMVINCDPSRPEEETCTEINFKDQVKTGLNGTNGVVFTPINSAYSSLSESPGLIRLPDNDGFPGVQGLPGLRGPIGLTGQKGEAGFPGPIGPLGLKGSQGLAGERGYPGLDGVPGLPGIDGIPGKRGDKGERGDSGLTGPRGFPGPPGAPGLLASEIKKEDVLPGFPGVPGEPGIPGPPGINGQKGEPGARGMPGLLGLKGERGLNGEPGQRGFPGIKGDPGAMGPPGPAGLRGRDGFVGKPGANGHRGEKGAPGEDGIPGIGMIGLKGEPGLEGEKGNPGFTGVPGKPGHPGPIGFPGRDGKIGPPGLPGKPGVDGKKGQDGFPGIPGQKGDEGRPGMQGVIGSPGPKGNTGMPGPRGPPGKGFSTTDLDEIDWLNLEGKIKDVCKAVLREQLDELKAKLAEFSRLQSEGRTGPPGIPGIPGPKGESGLPGLPGAIGLQGYPGQKGEPGSTDNSRSWN